MVVIWTTSATANSITLSDGRLIDLSAIPGQGWPVPKLEKARQLLQGLLDRRIPAADIPADEETLGWTPEQMQAVYGNRLWYDGGDLVSRSVEVVAVTWDGEKLGLSVRNP